MTADYPRRRVRGDSYRLVPSRFPPVRLFENVASAEDLEAVMELEGWTNDRLVAHRLARLPRAQWVYGRANASVVMAAFLHAAPQGQRFSAPELGAWYAGLELRTSIADVAHHLRREAVNAGKGELRGQYRTYVANLKGQYLDIRGAEVTLPEVYDSASHAASQAFGEAVRASQDAGIVYDSLRYRQGNCIVCYRPRNIQSIRQADHYEITVRPRGRVTARRLEEDD